MKWGRFSTKIRRLSLLKMTVVAVVAWTVAGAAAWAPLPGVKAAPQISDGVTFRAEQKLFTYNEQPKLKLAFSQTTKTSFLGPENAYAATDPKIVVDYGGWPVAIPVQVTPDGADYIVTLEPSAQLKPGSYKVTASGEMTGGQKFSQSDTFAWGVLAINTTKSIYLPGETASIQMAALSSTGHTLCAAPLELSITDPSGSTQHPIYQTSSSCQGDSFSSEPDYTASYKTGAPGRYLVKLGIAGTAYFATTSFEVKLSVPFDITCTGPTRLYPTHPYYVEIHVVANEDFTGNATETISDPRFKVLQSPGASIAMTASQVVLTWPVRWTKGGQYDLIYEFLAPPVSPAFYTMGPFKLMSTSGAIVFQEARAWQLAADAAITFVKETDIPVNGTASLTSTGTVSSTAGDTLILLVCSNFAATSNELQSVSDGLNTWITPPGAATDVASQDPPGNGASGTSSEISMAYTVDAAALSGTNNFTITIHGSTTGNMAFDVLEFSNIDPTNPVDQSASTTFVAPGGSFTVSTPTENTTTCDSPTTAEEMRGGDFFCTSPNELVVALLEAGHITYSALTAGYTATGTMSSSGQWEGVGAYEITSVSAAQTVSWDESASKAGASGIMIFRQNGNTSGGDRKPFFWEP
ncbi:MAG TPA: hypothetical protein VMS08_03940 [Candidatus Saccharimonadia bacterium]|nr:hypothetical protein [Candidatus Saccharimonadia bacterium]